MKVTLMRTGCGPVPDIQADYVVGAARLLEGYFGRKDAATRAEDILELLLGSGCKDCAVLYSGDTGFYSGARTLLPLLTERGIEAEVRPGLSSVQLLAARLGRPWQDWALCSAHGTDCDPVAAVCQGKPAFFLTGGPDGPARLCGELVRAGLGELPEILQAVRRANPKARVCVSAISLETLHAAMAELRDPEVTQISVSRSRPAEQLHLLLAQNPVFLITGALS